MNAVDKTKKSAKPLIFKKIVRGMYINHEWKMGYSHELVWSTSEGRRWEAYWHESAMWGLMSPTRRTAKFDTAAAARAFLNSIAAGEHQ
jgi:hypothetical protein